MGRDPNTILARLAGQIDNAVIERVQAMTRKRNFKKGSTVSDYLTSEKKENWTRSRVFVASVINSTSFDIVLGVMISCNLGIMVIQTDVEARGDTPAAWIRGVEFVFSVWYVCETLLRIYVNRWDFCKSGRDMADAGIVLSDILTYALNAIGNAALPSISFLRLFRLFRLARAIRFLILFPHLQMLMKGLVFATRALFWGMLLIFVFLVIWGMLAVQMIHPLIQRLTDAGEYDDCSRCPRAFSSVWQSILTLTQTLVAGDSWGSLAMPLIEHYPVTYFFFMLALTCISLAVMNLILALVVDAALEARRQHDKAVVEMKEEIREQATTHLLNLCRLLDTDGTGTLSLQELQTGMEENQDFAQSMLAMDVCEGDLQTVFDILDTDGSGDVDYAEFVKEMQSMRMDDSHTLLVFIKHYTKSVYDELRNTMIAETTKSHENAVERTCAHIEKVLGEQSDVNLASVVREEVGVAMRAFYASHPVSPRQTKDDHRLRNPARLEKASNQAVEVPKDRPELFQDSACKPAAVALSSFHSEAELTRELESDSGQLRKKMEELFSTLEDVLRGTDMVVKRPRSASRPVQTNTAKAQPSLRAEGTLSQLRPAEGLLEEPGRFATAERCQTPSQTAHERRSAWSQRPAPPLSPEQEMIRDYANLRGGLR